MLGVRLFGLGKVSGPRLEGDAGLDAKSQGEGVVDGFSRTQDPSQVSAPRRTWPSTLAGVLIATVTVGVFAATMGCQSQAGQGAPLDATPEAAVEQTTGLADPMPHRIQSPHGDFHARPPQQHIADWPPAQKKPSGDVSASKAQVRSPHGDFEALPPASPKN